MEIQVIYVDLPPRVKGMTVKTFDYEGGDDYYTIVLNARLNAEQQKAAYEHELAHIEGRDFEKADVNKIESEVRNTQKGVCHGQNEEM